MAEYFISYKEIRDLIDEYIALSEDSESLSMHRTEILSAITGEFHQQNVEAVQEMIAMWDNQTLPRSELLLGTKYIRIQHCMIEFLKVALCSGLVDWLLQAASQGSAVGFTVSVGASITIALWELFSSVKKLGDWDFCVYMQAVTHFREHKNFTMDELRDWLPSSDRPSCNMHNDKWECDHLGDDDTCMLLDDERLESALRSLMDKGILTRETERDTYTFKFER